ncbi:hypothetical protein ACE41I_17430 [Bacillus cereus]
MLNITTYTRDPGGWKPEFSCDPGTGVASLVAKDPGGHNPQFLYDPGTGVSPLIAKDPGGTGGYPV